MPVVEQSKIRLEYPTGDEQQIGTNGTIVLRARVSPPHVNNRIWFAYQIDEGQWVRSQAARESADADAVQYSLLVDVSTAQAGLRYMAFVRRSGITVPSGADTKSPAEDEGLKDLTAYISLTRDNGDSPSTPSTDESSHDLDIGLAEEAPDEGSHTAASPVASPTERAARKIIREQPLALTLNRDAIRAINESASEVQPIPDTSATSTTPVTFPASFGSVASFGSYSSQDQPQMEVCISSAPQVDNIADELRSHVSSAPQVGSIGWAIRGHIEAKEISDFVLFAGCAVEIFFEQTALTDLEKTPVSESSIDSMRLFLDKASISDSSFKVGHPNIEAATIKARLSTQLDESGKFEITLPSSFKLASRNIRLVVSAPSGETLADKAFDIASLTDCVRFPIPKVRPIPRPTDIPEPETRRIRGRVIERNCKPLPSCLQILLFARKLGDGNTEAVGAGSPIFVARADSSGYFFGDGPNEKYEQAIAHVAGFTEEINVSLKDGFIAVPVLLVVDLPETGIALATADGCNCEGSIVPRAPSHSDIEESPDTYSADLGTGGCIQFNTPNRAIEEFGFYSVVRTTEPFIRTFGGNASRATSHVQGMDNDIPTDDVLKAVEEAAKAMSQEVEATAADAAVEVAEAEKIATQREAEAKTAREYLVDLEAKKIGDFISATTAGGLFLTKKYLQDQKALAERAEAVATAARVAADAAKVKAVATTKDIEAAKASAAAKAAAAMKAIEAAKAAVDARARAKAAAAASAKTGSNKAPGRLELNELNSVDWDSTPTFYEATTIALGHLLHFKQVWYADGYSLGDLLYSLPLAPGQKKLISVLDWERREGGQRIEDTFSSEALNAAMRHDRDLGEVVSGTLTESSRGGSKSTSVGVGVGTGAAGNGSYQGFNFGALIGISGGYGESNSSAWQDSSRSLSSNSLQTLRDNTLQSASAIRSLRSSVVQTVTQGEAVRATTEVVANHNHCHALTIQYFEVLRHLKVTHELTDVQECLFVPLPMTEFDRAKVLRWRQTLQLYLQRRELMEGFDATRRVETAWSEVDFPANRYADEKITSISGELQLTIMIPLPPLPERPKPRPEDTIQETISAVQQATVPTAGWLGVGLAVLTGGASLVAGATVDAVNKVTKAATTGAWSLAEDLYAQPTAQERYNKFYGEVVPSIVEGFVDQLELWARTGNNSEVQIPSADFTLVSAYQPGVPLPVSVRATLDGQTSRADLVQLTIKSAKGLPSGCRAIINTANIRYQTKKFEHTLVEDRRVNDDIDLPKERPVITPSVGALPSLGALGLPNPSDLPGIDFASIITPLIAPLVRASIQSEISIERVAPGKGATLFTPVDAWEQRNPKKEDARLTAELLEHVNDNLEFYHHAMWWTMDPNRRYMLLDGYYCPWAEGRSVASVIENKLIGIVGNSLVMPVARGNHLDPRFPKGQNAKLLDFYALDSPVPAARVSLPTRGVFAEAVMGTCNACEQIDDSRFWRWEESPIDEPPAIEPLSTATRRSEPANMQPTAFPTPIVSIQNAPSVPNPTGVGTVLQALGQESFRDITGLAGTQANAAAAYQQALDTAYKFGKEASTLAQQAAMLKASDKTMNAIDNAEADGKITADEAKELRMSALKKMVGEKSADDKAATEADVDQKKATTETIRKIPGESVESVDTKNSSGETTSIKTRPEGTVNFDYKVPGIVPAIAQPSSMTCWATVATMMVSWRDKASYRIQDVMDIAGQTYRNKFDNNQGLAGSEKDAFLASLGMIGEPPMSYTVDGLKALLETYGPLWVTTDEQSGAGFSIHARIITGMFGNGTVDGTLLRVNDPAGGRKYTETFRTFLQKFEEVAAAGALRVQVVHFDAETTEAASTDAGSGASTLSGASWVSQFPGSADINDLEPTFGADVKNFTAAIEEAGGTISISSTYRPPERAYLIHWSWEIAKNNYNAQTVPSIGGVNINWWHGNAAASKQAAQDMVNGYGTNNLQVSPSLTSRHIERKAIDMDISWTGNLNIKKADGSRKNITSTPRDSTNSDLIAVGKTYNVIHFINVAKDPPHWSTDGK